MADWDRFGGGFPPKSTPRPVKDGLKAKSRRGAIGESWWSQRFIAVLERFGEGPRLARGRAYARRGQVLDLDVDPGSVTARVQGSRVRPYRVEIRLEPLSDDDWRRAEEAICGQAVFLARLLSGEMPEEIEEAFSACSLALFPAKRKDLVSDCSCPDWSNPCKHIAAVYYLLAERFDEDPFLILAWRGRPRERLLAELRELRGAAPGPDEGARAEGASWAAFLVPDAPLDPSPERFWGSATPAIPMARSRPTATPGAILRELPSSGLVAGGRTIEERLAPAYAAIVAAAAELLASGAGDDGDAG
jgi:uncharacterized Zn finger protein